MRDVNTFGGTFMSENAQRAYEAMQSTIGSDPVAGEWFEISQERINDFDIFVK